MWKREAYMARKTKATDAEEWGGRKRVAEARAVQHKRQGCCGQAGRDTIVKRLVSCGDCRASSGLQCTAPSQKCLKAVRRSEHLERRLLLQLRIGRLSQTDK